MGRKNVYEFCNNRVAGIEAQVVGEVLEELRNENNGKITPGIVVEAARRKDSPIHNYFEWDDSIAGEKYRREQAGTLIRSVAVTIVKDDDATDEPRTIRAFTSVVDNNNRFYTTTAHALSNHEFKKQVLDGLVRDIESLRRKYEAYRYADIHGVFEVIGREVSKIIKPAVGKKRKTAKQNSKRKTKRRGVVAA